MELDWGKAIKDFINFSIPTFEEATERTSLIKLKEEIKEIEQLLDSELDEELMPEIPKEYVDCLMCLFDSAARINITPEILLSEFIKKTEINKSREWVKNIDNTYSHKK